MARENWYEAGLSAEDDYICYVHLTESERKAVKKFMEQLYSGEHCICDKGWCGKVWCDDNAADVDFEIEEN